MISTIRLEMMKWRRSRLLVFALIGMLIGPVVGVVSSMQSMNQGHGYLAWSAFFALSLQVNHMMLLPLVFGALASYVFVQEYQGGAIINLYTLPVSRAKILFAKFATVFLYTMLLTAVSGLLTFAIGAFATKNALTMHTFWEYFGLSMEAGVLLFLLVPVPVLIGIWTKHFVPPLVVSGLFILLNFISLIAGKVGPMIPTAIPTFMVLKHISWTTLEIPFVWSMLLPIFLVFTLLSLLVVIRRDVN